MKISLREIKQSYAVLKSVARQRLDAGDIGAAYNYIRQCEMLAEQYNWIYADDELEQMMREIGEHLIPQTVSDYEANPNRVVLFDDFCLTYILALQYLEALLKAGKEVLYVSTRPIEKEPIENFYAYIQKLKGLQILRIEEPDICKRIQRVHDTIVDFRPAHLLLQTYGISPVIPVLYRLPKQIKSYMINQADQRFWLGVRAISHCIEFRPFGVAVSLERRGLKRERLLMLPFYPIRDKNPFEGFPKEADGHITIFSGGDVYKTMDTKRAYWRLIKRLLDTYPDVRFLFATKVNPLGDAFLNHFIQDNHFENRFIPIGFRKDIFECLKHCDIYMGTSPTSGSLMSQLAAINATPVLQYYNPGTPDDETEQALCINDTFPISFQDEDAFMQEADKLIKDAQYRKAQGERIQKSMIQPEQFDKALMQIIDKNESLFPVETKDVDYKLIDDRWYEMERCGLTSTLPYVISLLKECNSLKRVPSLYWKKQIQTLKNLFK